MLVPLVEAAVMIHDFAHATLGQTGKRVGRLGLSGTYRPGRAAFHKALDEGVNYFFCYGFDGQTVSFLRELSRSSRDKYVVATGAYNLIWTHQNLRKTLEKRLRQLRTDYLDVFQFLGVMKPKEFPEQVQEELRLLKEDGRVRAVGMSCHDRKFAGQLAGRGVLDMLMIRYNAAHRGAEQDIFPHLGKFHPGVVSYTATRWGFLLRRPGGWPKDGRIPTASMCYRFVLSNPHVDVCMTAPRNLKQLEENLAALRQGPLPEEEMRFMREFGDVVHRAKKWFM
jgi:aryl-alcohol dehydrogenase-like predicted oxidoreductase